MSIREFTNILVKIPTWDEYQKKKTEMIELIPLVEERNRALARTLFLEREDGLLAIKPLDDYMKELDEWDKKPSQPELF